MDTDIVVKGSATLRVMPDRAVLRVEVDGEGQPRDEAYRQAAPRAAAVDEVVERHRTAIAQVVTASGDGGPDHLAAPAAAGARVWRTPDPLGLYVSSR
jgi:uncharacterized protein YggE